MKPSRSVALFPPPIVAYFGLGVLALGGAGHQLGNLLGPGGNGGLVPVGEATVELDRAEGWGPVEVLFRLKNPTRRPIRIERLDAHCRCTVASLSGEVVPPAGEALIRVRADSFDTYKSRFVEHVTVRTDRGHSLDLWVRGATGARSGTVCYPPRLFMRRDGDGGWPARTLRVRVPVACGTSSLTARPLGLCLSAAEVEEVGRADDFREYRVIVRAKPEEEEAAGGAIRLETGCEPLEVPVSFAG